MYPFDHDYDYYLSRAEVWYELSLNKDNSFTVHTIEMFKANTWLGLFYAMEAKDRESNYHD